jgi:hypothetical protein
LEELDKSGLALVLALDDLEPGAVVVVSPLLQDREAAMAAHNASTENLEKLRERLAALVAAEASAWRKFYDSDDAHLLLETSRKTLKQALKSAEGRQKNGLGRGKAVGKCHGGGSSVPNEACQTAYASEEESGCGGGAG